MNAVALLTKDHRAVKDLFAKFDASEPEQRSDVLTEIIRELSVHAAIEEAHLYPLIEKEVEGGKAMVDEAIEEHQGVKEILARLDSKTDKAHTKEVADMVARLQRDVEHHVKEEEGEVFPKLEHAVAKTRLEDVGRELKQAKE